METWTANRTLWLTAGRDEAVEDGDDRAAFLLASKGKKIPLADAKRLGLTAKKKPAAKPASDDDEKSEKQAAKPQDKQAARPQDKGKKKG